MQIRVATILALCAVAGCHTGQEPQPKSGDLQSRSPSPHRRQVLVTTETLPAESYIMLGEVSERGSIYMSDGGLLDRLAVDAQAKGAEAIIEIGLSPGFDAKFFPAMAGRRATGKAISFQDPCAFNPSSVKAEYYPRQANQYDPPVFTLCKNGQQQPSEPNEDALPSAKPTTVPAASQVNANAPGGSADAACSVEQILTMKNAGLSDDRIKKACSDAP